MIDNLPNGWKVEKLGDISKIKTGRKDANQSSENGKYLFFTCSKQPLKCDEYSFSGKAIILAGNGDLNNIFLYDGDFEAYQRTYVVQNINSNLRYDFLFYNLKYFWVKYNEQKQYGSIINYIKIDNLNSYPIPIPPLQQQEKIVKVLDLTSNLIEKQKELLEKYDLFLKSKFIEMFGDLNSNPMNWEIEKLDNVIILDAKMVQPNTPEYENLLHIGPDRIEKNTGKLLPALTAKEEMLISKKFFFTNEYILYSKIRPYLNKVAMPSFSGLCSADMYPVKPLKNKINKAYLWKLLLSSYFIKYTETLPDRASIPKLNKKELVEFSFPLPPLKLQNQFASIVEKIETIKEKENQKLKKLEDLHNSLMNKAFKGEIE